MVDKLKKSKTILGSYYVINLKRRPDRLELFKKNCPLDNSKINRFEAVDGKLSTSIPDNFKSLSKGEVGCFLSHKLLWEKTLKQKDSDYSIIFEDDAIFTENFQEDFNDIINTDINFNIPLRSIRSRTSPLHYNLIFFFFKNKMLLTNNMWGNLYIYGWRVSSS